jgi:hypothetical protein
MAFSGQELSERNHSPSESIAPIVREELEMPDYAAADEIVMLARLAGIGQRKVRRARKKIANFAAKTEVFETRYKGTHVQS